MDDAHGVSDAQLVAAARAGDTAAFEELYRRHVPGVQALVRSMIRDSELVDDVVQTTFVRAWERLPKLRAGAAFRVWVRRTAHRAVLDALRANRVRRSETLDEPDARDVRSPAAGPEAEVVGRAVGQEIRAAVQGLPEHQRVVVVLHHFDDLPVHEVAQVLGLPLGTVLSRLARARGSLRERLSRLVANGGDGH